MAERRHARSSPPSLADNLQPLLGECTDRVSVDEIIARVERHEGLAPVMSILTLPLPFANLFPALTVLMVSLGLTRRDGLVVIVGLGLLAVAVAAIAWGLHGARLGWHSLFH